MQILVTGASGTLGSHLLPELAREWPSGHRLEWHRNGASRLAFRSRRVDLTDRAGVQGDRRRESRRGRSRRRR